MPESESGAADVMKDTLLKVLIREMGDATLQNKSDAWIDARMDRLKKQEKHLARQMMKENDSGAVAHMGKVFHGEEVKKADKIALFKRWTRCVIPRRNYCWLSDYPREFLAVMLGFVDPDFQDELPTGSKDTLRMYITDWFYRCNKVTAVKKRREREQDEEEEEEEEAPAKRRKFNIGVPEKQTRRTTAKKAAAKPATAKPVLPRNDTKAPAAKAAKRAAPAQPQAPMAEELTPQLPPRSSEDMDELSHHSSWLPATATEAEADEVAARHLPDVDENDDNNDDDDADAASAPAPTPPCADSKYSPEDVAGVVAKIRRRLQFGESQVATLAELAEAFEIDMDLALEAARMMQKHADLLLDESIGVVYIV